MKLTSKKAKLITAIIASVAVIGAGVGVILATQPKNDSSTNSSSTQAHTHEYTATVTKPTCTQAGYTTHKCDCGDEYVDSYVNATNHNFKNYIYDNNATCTANGTETATCGNKNCSQKNTRVKANSITTHNIEDSGWCSMCDQAIAPTKGILYDVSTDGTYAEVIGYEGTSTKVNIATTYSNLPVKAIADNAFADNTTITTVLIPDSVNSIGEAAFLRCHDLANVSIGKGVLTIGENAFYACFSLTSITIPDRVTTIGFCSFASCEKLTNIIIGNAVSFIDRYAFSNCTTLSNIILPNNVTYIGDNLFYGCSNLTSITFENTTNWISNTAYNKTIEIPSEELSNPIIAAVYLKSIYNHYPWQRMK